MARDKGSEGMTTNADGSYVTSTTGSSPTANGEGGTIVYGDITTGPGYHVIGPPSVGQTSTDLYKKASEVVGAVDGNAAALGPGDASASPGTVTRGATMPGP